MAAPGSPSLEKTEAVHEEHVPTLDSSKAHKAQLAAAASNVDGKFVKLTWRSFAACFFACFITILTQLVAVTGPANIISFLISDLGRADLSGWVLQAPVIAQACLAPILGRLSDEVGRKWIITIMPLFGVVGAVIASRAGSMNTLIGGAVLVGLATAPVGLNVSVPSEVLPAKYRAYAQSVVQISGSAAGAIAALGSGAMVGQAADGWRNFYYMTAALFAVSSLGTLAFYNPPPRPGSVKSWKQILHECDVIGSLLVTGCVSLIIVGLNYGSSLGFESAYFYGPLVGGLICLFIAIWYEGYIRNDGLFHHDLFKLAPRNFSIAIFCFFMEGWLYFSGVAVYFPQQNRYLGWETRPFYIGVRKFIFSAMNVFLIFPIVLIVTKFKDVKWLLSFAYMAFLISMCCFATSGVEDSINSIGFIILASIGMCPQLIALNIVIQCTAPANLIATASSLALTIRGVGGAFGSAVMGSQISQRMTRNLAPAIVPVAVSNGLPQSSAGALVAAFRTASPVAISNIPGITPAIIALITPITRETYAAAFRIAWATVIPAAGLGLIAMLCLDNSKVKARLNNTIDATVEKVENVRRKEEEGDKVDKEGLRV